MLVERAAAILTLGDVDPGVISREELATRIVDFDRLESLLTAQKMRVLAHGKKRSVGEHDQVRSTTKWVSSRTRRREYAVGSEINTAHDVVFGLPEVFTALENAAINVDHVKAIRSVYRKARFAEAAQRDQALFLEWAYEGEFALFESKLTMWMVVNDPIDPETLDDVDFDSRGLKVAHGFGNTMLGQFSMPTVMWEQFLTFVQPRFDRMWAEDWAEATARLGDDVCAGGLWRSDSQRWLDAMMEAIRASAGDAAASDFVVNLICDAETLEEEIARQLGDAVPEVLPTPTSDLDVIDLPPESTPPAFGPDDTPIPLDRRCETESGLPVSPSLMVLAAMSGRLRRVVFAASTIEFEMSESVRLFRGNQRLGIRMRDRHCRGPGCSTHASLCDIDHIEPYGRGGKTVPHNGQALCRGCHRYKTKLEALGIW